MKIWRIVVLVAIGLGFVRAAAAVEPVVVTFHIQRAALPVGIQAVELLCPPGFFATFPNAEMGYPPGTPESARDSLFVTRGVIDKDIAGVQFIFDKQNVGNWSEALFLVSCYPLEGYPEPPVLLESTSPGAKGATTAGGYTQCPSGQTAMGGSGGIPFGRNFEFTINSQLFDPWALPPFGAYPILSDMFGECPGSGACDANTQVVCGYVLNPSLASGKQAVDTPPQAKHAASKATVAAGAVGSVSVTCPDGMISTAGGYISLNPTQTQVLALNANTSGTPYSQRLDGTHEAPTGWTATIKNLSASPNQIGATAVCVPKINVPAPPNYQGLWWADPPGSESGWGINFTHQGDIIFATWFTYDANGKPTWFIAELHKGAAGVYTGDVSSVTGVPFDSTPWDTSKITETKVGTMTVTYSDATHGSMAYTVNGISQTKAIVPQTFAAPVPSCVFGIQTNLALATGYQDLWWAAPAGSEAGWGINFTQQGDIIFFTWFTYDANGKPTWFIAVAFKTGDGVFSGQISTVVGNPFNAVPWNVSKQVETEVGSTTITFADGNRATFSYTVNGVTQVKQIVRQVFVNPGTLCQ